MGFLDFIKKSSKRELTIGILGEVNAGKTTLANFFGKDLTGADSIFGTVSEIPHETREVIAKHVELLAGGKKIELNLVDTPGIASSVDYRTFLDHGMTRKEAMQRAKEATTGVVKAVQSLDTLDAAIVVVDAARQPFNQVNWTIVGNLEARKVPIIVAANKIDLPDADASLVEDVFDRSVVSISALNGTGMDQLYSAITKCS